MQQRPLDWAARLRRDVDVEGRLLELERRQGLRHHDADASNGEKGGVQDHKVLEGWMAGFRRSVDGDRIFWEGNYGTPSDLMQRIEIQRAKGAPWFNQLLAVFGRRGSKGYLGSILIAWRIWLILMIDNPHKHFAAAEGKPLGIYIFGTKAEQARRDQFGDVEHLLLHSPVSRPSSGVAPRAC